MPRKPRSRYGEGSIYRDRRGHWTAAIVDDTGQRQYVYGRTEQEVRDWLKQARRTKEDGLPLPSTQPLGEYLTDWLESDTRKKAITSTSWVAYENHIRLHINPVLGTVRLADLQPEHVDRLTSALIRKGLAPKSIKNIRGTLRAALEHARKRGHLNRNVVELSEAPRVPKREKRPLSPDDVRRIFQAVMSHRLAALWILDVATGLRKGELLGLRLQDVDLAKPELHVLVQLQRDRVTGKVSLRELKTQGAARTIALPGGVARLLQAHLALREREREAAGRRWTESGLLFTTDRGAPLDGDNVLRAFQALLRRAGLPRLTMHDLRHAHSSFLALLNIHPKVAQRQLGHSNISTTMDVYTHVSDEGSREIAAKFDALLFETAEQAAGSLPIRLGFPDQIRDELELQAQLEGCALADIVLLAVQSYLDATAAARQRRASGTSLIEREPPILPPAPPRT